MRHRRVERERPQARQRHLQPRAAVLGQLPVQRRLPALRLHGVPAVGQPQLRIRVAAGLDEREPLAVGHGARGQAERPQRDDVARRLVVERERRAGVARLDVAAVEPDPAGRRGRGRGRRVVAHPHRRAQRVLREQVQQVGEDQLLVLLLVVQAQLDQVAGRGGQPRAQQVGHRLVDMLAVGAHLRQRRARQQAAARPLVARADGVVVRVEQEAEALVEAPVAGAERREHELLEEPGGVREVPLAGARELGGLRRQVGVVQAVDQAQRGGTDFAIGIDRRRHGKARREPRVGGVARR